MARGGMTIVDGIGPVLDAMVASAALNVEEAFRNGAQRVEQHAKQNAPWADRTGQARAGLTAEVSLVMGEVVLTLFHTAEHGQWLEVIQDGRFAIIMPTLEELGPEIMADAGAAVLEIERGFF